jgi:hypothetical protein
MTFNDDFLPYKLKFQVVAEIKYVGRVQGSKKNVNCGILSATVASKMIETV